ncbi:MAG: NAD-dependent epimerase/dehydratase family protein [Deltaproteobacteria bacterium]|nr:NAD-dependent epimerase/dehydratase family protein [Deltaproteobacteria bacterium]
MKERIIITGIAGSLARLCAEELHREGHEVIGVDYRTAPPGLPKEIVIHRANYNKTRIVDVFRKHRPTMVLHLGRVGNLKEHPNKRFDLNVIGSAKLMDLSNELKVKRFVVLSTFHIYGAHPHNHIPIHEEEPLRAGQNFAQLADAVQLDNQANTWVYRHRNVRTVVLRPTNIVGPDIKNAIASYLRQSTVFHLLGFNPMWQFVHQTDMVRAIMLAAKGEEVGVFNVAGTGELPIVDALELTRLGGQRVVAVPSPLASAFLRLSRTFGQAFPTYLIDFFKYACVISDERFRKAFGYAPQVDLVETVRSNQAAARAA